MITETIKNFSEQKIIASLLILTFISILARLYFLPFEIPILQLSLTTLNRKSFRYSYK